MLMRPVHNPILNSSDSKTIAIASTATVYTKSFKFPYGGSFGISAKATSSGTINLQIELEESWKEPVNEGVADVYYVVPDGISDIWSAITDSNQHHKAISPVVMRYGRFKITGLTGNDAATTVQMQLHYQEDL